MRKRKIQNIVLHINPSSNTLSRADRVSKFHVEIIERRLKQADLTPEKKIEAIDRIISALRRREVGGVIK